jgi:tetratricopeptide (TPR) repeat protein
VAYVRRRGNQLAIVVGEREPSTKKVEQRVLFTLYSKPEALEMLGRGADPASAHRFEGLLEHAHPGQRFDWKAIRAAVEADLGHLPETYEYKGARLSNQFRHDLVALTRSLAMADPQSLASAAALVRENRDALAYLQDLIDWRLETCGEKEANRWTADNAFFWRFALQGPGVPPDAEEHAAGFWEKRDLPRAEAAFQLYVEAFPDYAEGWNYLGLIALERDEPEVAEGHFRKTIELGRALFSKRIARSAYWNDLRTRPYMRGLRNLTNTLIRAARWAEASEIVTRLDDECDDALTVSSYRATIALNTGDWKTAAEESARLAELCPEERFVEAFARFERGERRQAVEAFLHAALAHPGAARMVLSHRSKEPRSFVEAEDHNAGVSLLVTLHGYLGKRSLRARRFFSSVLGDENVARLLEQVEKLRHDWHTNRKGDKAAFDDLKRMQSAAFARSKLDELAHLFAGAQGPDDAVGARRSSSRRASSPRLIH